jgi:hypothetical protein
MSLKPETDLAKLQAKYQVLLTEYVALGRDGGIFNCTEEEVDGWVTDDAELFLSQKNAPSN